MVCAAAYTRNKNQAGGGYNYNSTEILGFANIPGFANPVPEGRLIDGTGEALAKTIYKNLPEEQAGVALADDAKPGDEVLVKIGISCTRIENARKNLEAECPIRFT